MGVEVIARAVGGTAVTVSRDAGRHVLARGEGRVEGVGGVHLDRRETRDGHAVQGQLPGEQSRQRVERSLGRQHGGERAEHDHTA
jgi:hypothetical protein